MFVLFCFEISIGLFCFVLKLIFCWFCFVLGVYQYIIHIMRQPYNDLQPGATTTLLPLFLCFLSQFGQHSNHDLSAVCPGLNRLPILSQICQSHPIDHLECLQVWHKVQKRWGYSLIWMYTAKYERNSLTRIKICVNLLV